MSAEEQHRPGTLRWRDPDTGEVRTCAPNSPWFSTATFMAEEYFDASKGGWVRIHEDEDAGCACCGAADARILPDLGPADGDHEGSTCD